MESDMQQWKVVLSSLMVGAFGAVCVAQDAPAKDSKDKQPPARERPARDGQPRGERPGGGQGRGQLSPEKAKAAWDLEAKGVAKRAGLTDAQTSTLVKAYEEARASQNEAFDKARKEMQDKAKENGDEGGGGRQRMGPEVMQKLNEVNAAERTKFEKALGDSIPSDKKSAVLASLGTFNRQWDNMTDAIMGFNLEPAKQQEAQNAIEDYILVVGKARSAAGDQEAMREAMQKGQEARQKLSETMKKLLSEEQFGKFEAAMGPGGRGRGPGGGGDGENPRPRRNREGGGDGGEGRKPAGDKPGGGGR
jgi:hypothetical protein